MTKTHEKNLFALDKIFEKTLKKKNDQFIIMIKFWKKF